MSGVSRIINSPISQWIRIGATEQLTGRARHCAVNAWNFLIRAEDLATRHQTVSFFCVTHAVEEAVAAFIWSAKGCGYNAAKSINLKDHGHKAVIQEFARMIADDAGGVKMAITLKEDDNVLFARVTVSGADQYHPLWIGLLSYNPDPDDTDPSAAEASFISRFSDEAAMVKRIRASAGFRNDALYASKGGAPCMTDAQLAPQLRQYTVIALGLLWAAADMPKHAQQEPFILQILEAARRVAERLDKDGGKTQSCPS